MTKGKVISIIAAAIIAAGCTDGPTGQTTVPGSGTAPTVRFSDESTVIIYPAEYDGNATVMFEAKGADEVCIKTEEGFNVTTELTRLEGDSWKLDLSEAEGMEKGKKYEITITAENKYGKGQSSIYAETAYLENPFGASEAHYLGNGGKTFDLFVEGNVEWEIRVDADDLSWSEVQVKASNHFLLKILPNETKSPRELTLTVTDKAGVYSYSCIYGQDRCSETQDEIQTMEKAAIIAICEAFAIPYDADTPYPTNEYTGEIGGVGGIGGIAEYNSKGYVTKVGLYGAEGVIPEEIGDLKHCKELIISNAKLSGKLPESIGEMSSLKAIELTSMEGYGLEGNLSESSLSKIAGQLYHIDVAWNNFTGPCPEWLGDTPGNAIFWIYMNRLEGKVPEKVQAHPDWNRTIPDGSGRLAKEVNMVQQEGYALYE